MSLRLLGAVLFGARLVDTLQDPWLGRLVDRWQQRGWTWLLGWARWGWRQASLPCFAPPALNEAGLAGWLAVSLVLAYTAHSLVSVCYLTWGARISDDR